MSSSKIGATIFHLLSNDANVVDMVSSRIFPNIAPAGSANLFPYIVYFLVSSEATDTKGSLANPGLAIPTSKTKNRRSPLDIMTLQISMFSVNYSEAVDLAVAVRNALDNVVDSGEQPTTNGPKIDSLIFESENSEYEKDILPDGVHHISQDYKIRIITS